MKINTKRGFTIIELLIVITIIGLLSVVVLDYLGNAKIRTRDTTRAQNLDQLVKATNLYYSQNGDLPGIDGDCISVSNSTFVAIMAPYIKQVPSDPANSLLDIAGNYIYNKEIGTNGKYRYCAIMENSAKANGTYAGMCGGSTTYNYCVTQ